MYIGISRRVALAVAAVVLVAGCIDRYNPTPLPEGTRLVLVRHTDRDGPQLNDLGIRRAAILPSVIRDVPLEAIYSPDLQRNIDSATPLAEDRGLVVELLDRDSIKDTILGIAAGRSVIWVGNSTNLRDIWFETLRLPGDPPVKYGEIAIVEAGPDGEPNVSRRQFGPPI